MSVPRKRSTVRRRLLVALGTFLAALASAWMVRAVVLARECYAQVHPGARGWRGRIHTSSAELGFVPRAGAVGAETYTIGPDVACRVSTSGYRVPLDAAETEPADGPRLLALGCSFTWGSSVHAEETFAWRVAEALGVDCRNAGICGGGAAQMLLRARELLPRERPAWVLVQYSSWLLERARAPFAPTYVGRVATPYFARAEHGVELLPPADTTIVFDLPFDRYRESQRGLLDFLSFFRSVGLPLCIHDDLGRVRTTFARWTGPDRTPATDADVEAAVYPELARLCREHGARMVIVWIDPRALEGAAEVPPVLAALDAPVARCGERLAAELPERTRRAWNQAYTLIRGDPPRSIDPHPNARAHALIADEILRTIGHR